MTHQASEPKATEFIALMAIMTSLIALAIDAMLPALSEIGTDLGAPSENSTQWVVSAILVGMALGQLFYGPISDSTGRKPPVFVGFGIFVIGCVLSLTAQNFTVMLAGRLLQGFGAAGPRSVSIALIRDLYSGRDMARILSMVMSIFILIPIIAPALGQGIMAVGNWRMIFGVFLALAVVTSAWFALRQPESLSADKRRPFSFAGILTNFGAVLRNRAAMGFTITAGLSSGAFIGYLSSSQQIFHDVYGVGSKFALYFAILAASIGLASQVNGRLVMRLGMYRLAMGALQALAGLSFVFLGITLMQDGTPAFAMFMTYMLLAFFCTGILFGNMNSLAMEPLGARAGVGAAVVSSISLMVSVSLGAWVGMSFDGTIVPLVAGFAVFSLLSIPLISWSNRGREVEA